MAHLLALLTVKTAVLALGARREGLGGALGGRETLLGEVNLMTEEGRLRRRS